MTLPLICLAAFFRRRFFRVTVIGNSMRPTYTPGDRLLARRSDLNNLERGQAVVIKQPIGPSPRAADHGVGPFAIRWGNRRLARSSQPNVPRSRMGHLAVKRVVALPGDPLPQEIQKAFSHTLPERIPRGRFAVLGDNSEGSVDSRVYGLVPEDAVRGVIIRRLP
ncbi:S26 family signal peptidase [Sphaerisporangium melleum]